MKKIIAFAFSFLFLLNISFTQSDIEKALFELEDVIFKPIETPEGYVSAYELKIKQPLDHKDPDAGYFYQRVYLSHRSFDAPVVMVAEGYQRPANLIYEFSEYMQGNQVQVEHRYYGASVPEEVDFEYLNLEQAMADLHRINQLFREVYEGPYLCTGISKGGMTTLFYRYFYPEDVAVSVPYVAPINLEFKDKRIYEFLDTVGPEECRQKIVDFQRHLLKNKAAYLPLVKWYAKGQQQTFERLGVEAAYEYTVLEYSFSFWQLGHSCDDIPALTAGRDEILEHFLKVSGIDFFSDQTIDGYASFYYQMGTEMGYYGYNTEDFEGLITALEQEPSAVFAPQNVDWTFDATLTKKAHQWFTNELEQTVYINGGSDTWSATAVRPKPGLDVLVFNMSGKDHRQARIRNMSEVEMARLEATLERWLGIDVAGKAK